MSRVQLALNVSDIDESVTCDSMLFGTESARRRAGYASFALTEPPLRLLLLRHAGRCRQRARRTGRELLLVPAFATSWSRRGQAVLGGSASQPGVNGVRSTRPGAIPGAVEPLCAPRQGRTW